MKKRFAFALAASLAIGTVFLANTGAQELGVTKTRIKLGTWGPLSGPAQFWGTVMFGIEAVINKTNSEGGINGRKLELIMRDDGYEPARTKAVVKELVERQGVFALVGGVGTPNGLAILPDVIANRIPWVSPASGSAEFSKIINGKLRSPSVFSTYTNYKVESVLLLRHAVNTLNLSKIGVLYFNSGFGLEGLAGVQEEIARLKGKATLVASVGHEPTETSLAVQALKLKESGAEAVVMYTADTYGISLVREMAKIGYKPQILASSVLLGAGMFQAGPNSPWNGAIIASFLPVPGIDAKANAALGEYLKYVRKDKFDAAKGDPFRFLAGVAFAQPLIEGLKRAGPNLDRKSFTAAMESIKGWKDSLFNSISFAPNDRQGNNSVFLVKAVFEPKPGFEKAAGWVEFQ